MKIISLILILFFCSQASGQDVRDMSIAEMEDSLNYHLKQLREGKSDGEREMLNLQLKAWLEKVIVEKEAFDHPFDSLKTMGTVISPDKEFRLFNWNIENDDGSYSYYCYVVRPPKLIGSGSFIELTDRSAEMAPQPLTESLDDRKWFGALYYDIIPVKKGSKTLYTLLAWDGNDRLTTKKFIDVMYFSGSRRIKFGYPIFKTSKGVQKRFFLEYTSEQHVSLKHKVVKKEDVLVFDHLSPKAPQLEGIYSEYVIDGSHDAFKFEQGYWQFIPDFYAVNSNIKGDYNDPTKDNYDHQSVDPQKP